MCAKMAFQHQAGTAMECLSMAFYMCSLSIVFPSIRHIPITLQKEPGLDPEGREVLKCGFKIGGGIDQDYRKSPQGYTDNGIYVTEVHDGSPAAKSGLRMHDKILQCNGYDFTMVTHKKAVDYIKKHPILNLLVARKGVTST
ncbi:unnamed protein product [Timema podura]|uniref:PDZ domain-containing protein n=1 Tax=Timema podura TaxID=61482 RepID=A0ABN7NNJ4_TIMPD|nr:unnamed protein product [Timema podura]